MFVCSTQLLALFTLFLCCNFFTVRAQASEFEIRIGALFENGTQDEQRAFKMAVRDINKNKWNLPGAELSYQISIISTDSKSDVRAETCQLARNGIAALVTVAPCLVDSTVQEIGETLNIPTLQIEKSFCNFPKKKFFFSPLPDQKTIFAATSQLIFKRNYKNVLLLCESGQNVSYLRQILAGAIVTKSSTKVNAMTLLIPQVLTSSKKIRAVAKTINTYLRRRDRPDALVVYATPDVAVKFILLLSKDNLVGSEKLNWVVVSPGLRNFHLSDLETITQSQITVIRQTPQVTSQNLQRFVNDWNNQVQVDCNKCGTAEVSADDIPLSALYVYDGLFHLTKALSRLLADRDYRSPAPLFCERSSANEWKGGESLIQSIYSVNSSSLLGSLQLNDVGFQKNIKLDFMMKQPGDGDAFIKISTWSSENVTILATIIKEEIAVENKTFKVATVQEPPFVFLEKKGGKSIFTGFSVDLMNALSKQIGFKYQMYEVADRKYGTKQKNGTWNGLVGDVIKGEADVAIAAMTITADREKVVDFTNRYMDYSVGIVMKKPVSTLSLFSFIRPFHPTVWFCILSALLLVAVLIFVLNQVSPLRSETMDCNNAVSNEFTVWNVFWYVYSSLMQQGGDMTTITLPVRIVTAFWWFFALIVVSSYTANLAAFLTVSRMDSTITSFQGLANQKETEYGTVGDTSIFDYIMKKASDAEDSMYGKMSRMMTKKNNKIQNAMDGFDRVRNGPAYAFLWDVAVIDYEVLRDKTCSLMTISDTIYDKGYGIAFQQGSVYRDAISLGILKLQDSGIVDNLKQKWWPKEGKCSLSGSSTTKSSELNLENFSGVFCVLAAGLVFASILAGCEVLIHVKRGKSYPPKKLQRQPTIISTHRKGSLVVQNINDRRCPSYNVANDEVIVVFKKSELLQQLNYNTINTNRENNDRLISILDPSANLESGNTLASKEMKTNGENKALIKPRGPECNTLSRDQSQTSTHQNRPKLKKDGTLVINEVNSLPSTTADDEKLSMQSFPIHKLDPDDHYVIEHNKNNRKPKLRHYNTYVVPTKIKPNIQLQQTSFNTGVIPRKQNKAYSHSSRKHRPNRYNSISNLEDTLGGTSRQPLMKDAQMIRRCHTLQREASSGGPHYIDSRSSCFTIQPCGRDGVFSNSNNGVEMRSWQEPIFSPEGSFDQSYSIDNFGKNKNLPSTNIRSESDNYSDNSKISISRKSCV